MIIYIEEMHIWRQLALQWCQCKAQGFMGPEIKYSRRRNGKLTHQFTLAEQLEFQWENSIQILKDTSRLEIDT